MLIVDDLIGEPIGNRLTHLTDRGLIIRGSIKGRRGEGFYVTEHGKAGSESEHEENRAASGVQD